MDMTAEEEEEEDDEVMYFRAKRNSIANIVHEDDDEIPQRLRKRKKEESTEDLTRRMLKEMINKKAKDCEGIPPLRSNEVGDVDYSEAALVVVYGPSLKAHPKPFISYRWLLQFANLCRRKSCLLLFHHPGHPLEGGLGSMSVTKKTIAFANIAIKKYQQVSQNAKLQLRDLMKINYGDSGYDVFYLTFSAEDEMTGEVRPYQAVLAQYFPDNFSVGFV